MQNAEIELKFPVGDPALLESKLRGLGFHLDTPRTFEENTLYDTSARLLRESKQILRLRRYGDLWTLAHKRHPNGSGEENTRRYKIRIETETHLDDGPAMEEILRQLGYDAVFRYEKFRTEWSHTVTGDQTIAHLVLDETPIGIYAELEGPVDWIDRTLAELQVDPATCITDSYGKLFLAWKARTGSPVDHLTFSEIHSLAVTR